MKKGLVITGAILMLLAVIVAIALIIPGLLAFEDPTDENVGEIRSGESITLDEGTYELWCERDPGMVNIYRPGMKPVDMNEIEYDLEVMGVKLYYTFDIEEEGSYTVDYDSNERVYITQGYSTSFSFLMIPAGCCCGGVILLSGIILLIVGLVIGRK